MILSNCGRVRVDRCNSPLCRLDLQHPALVQMSLEFHSQSNIPSKQFATHNFKKANYNLVNAALSQIVVMISMSRSFLDSTSYCIQILNQLFRKQNVDPLNFLYVLQNQSSIYYLKKIKFKENTINPQRI